MQNKHSFCIRPLEPKSCNQKCPQNDHSCWLASEPRTCNDQWRTELSVRSDQTFMAVLLSQTRTNAACMKSPLRRARNLEKELRDVTEKYKPGNSTRRDCETNMCFAFAPWSPGPATRNDRNSITRASFAQWSQGPAMTNGEESCLCRLRKTFTALLLSQNRT